MTETRLAAERREGRGKGAARKLRQAGRVPAVVYGRDMDPLHLSVDAHAAELLFRSISVDNTIIDLDVAGERAPFRTLVRDIQMHPYRSTLVHVDFLRIQEGVAVETQVPIVLVGTPAGVRDGSGILEQIIHDLPIRAVPSALPEAIEFDVTGLDLHDVVHVGDLLIADEVEVLLPTDRTVCSISPARVAAEADEEAEEEAAGAEEADGAGADAGEG